MTGRQGLRKVTAVVLRPMLLGLRESSVEERLSSGADAPDLARRKKSVPRGESFAPPPALRANADSREQAEAGCNHDVIRPGRKKQDQEPEVGGVNAAAALSKGWPRYNSSPYLRKCCSLAPSIQLSWRMRSGKVLSSDAICSTSRSFHAAICRKVNMPMRFNTRSITG